MCELSTTTFVISPSILKYYHHPFLLFTSGWMGRNSLSGFTFLLRDSVSNLKAKEHEDVNQRLLL